MKRGTRDTRGRSYFHVPIIETRAANGGREQTVIFFNPLCLVLVVFFLPLPIITPTFRANVFFFRRVPFLKPRMGRHSE